MVILNHFSELNSLFIHWIHISIRMKRLSLHARAVWIQLTLFGNLALKVISGNRAVCT